MNELATNFTYSALYSTEQMMMIIILSLVQFCGGSGGRGVHKLFDSRKLNTEHGNAQNYASHKRCGGKNDLSIIFTFDCL